ncbi:hypothetical protein A4G20_10925 [Pasteurellaceae bacterium RH1A]|nr:hypothetical protein A4G20_10925 [Pasteurellaceae bacterium RH1A]
MKSSLLHFIRIFYIRFQENKLTVHAGYLTYSTLLAIVPLIMVIFSVFSAFPIFEEVTGQLKGFIYSNFAPNAGDMVQEYIDNFVSNTKQMSAVGIIGLIVVALMLIFSIDNTLNDMWHNTKMRSPLVSFAIYWMILTLGPILGGASIAISSYIFSMEIFSEDGVFSFGYHLLKLAPFCLTWLMFTLVYTVVPNTKVLFRHAAVGALLAAIFFTLGKQAFVWYITTFPSYQAIYGALATLPIMIVWIHASWLVVLLGAQFAAVLKDRMLIEEGELSLSEDGKAIQ